MLYNPPTVIKFQNNNQGNPADFIIYPPICVLMDSQIQLSRGFAGVPIQKPVRETLNSECAGIRLFY